MSDQIVANGETCELIIRKYRINDYEIGKTKVSFSFEINLRNLMQQMEYFLYVQKIKREIKQFLSVQIIIVFK